MNKRRRKELEQLKSEFEQVCSDVNEAVEKLEELKENIECLKEEEEEAYDNLPESLQEAEKGEAMQAAIDYMASAIDAVDVVGANLNETLQGFEDVYSAIQDAASC